MIRDITTMCHGLDLNDPKDLLFEAILLSLMAPNEKLCLELAETAEVLITRNGFSDTEVEVIKAAVIYTLEEAYKGHLENDLL